MARQGTGLPGAATCTSKTWPSMEKATMSGVHSCSRGGRRKLLFGWGRAHGDEGKRKVG